MNVYQNRDANEKQFYRLRPIECLKSSVEKERYEMIIGIILCRGDVALIYRWWIL